MPSNPTTCPSVCPSVCPPLQEIVVFKRRQLSYYAGNYEEYVAQVEERQLHQARQADAVERKREHTQKRWGGVSGV